MVKVLNAVNGDIIRCRRVLNEGSPYGEYYLRRVTPTTNDVNIINPSGICDGTKTKNNTNEDGDENVEEK